MSATGGGNLHDWKPLVDDLRRGGSRRSAWAGRSGSSASGRWASCRCASGSTCSSIPAPSSSTGCWPTPWTPASATGYLAADGVGHRRRRDRRPAGRGRAPTTSPSWPARWAQVGEHKTARMRELVLRQRIPIVWLLDSAGARIQSTSGSTFAGAGALFREQVTLSGVVPQVGGDARPLRGGHRLHPRARRLRPDGEGHVVDGARRPPPREGGDRARTSPRRRWAARRSTPRCRAWPTSRSPTTRSASPTVRRYLSFFPSHNGEPPPVASPTDPVDRRVEELYDIVPTAPRRAYDMRKVVARGRRRRRRASG